MQELKSNQEWKQWGKEDPLYGVASWNGKQKGGASPWTAEDFYSLGESDWIDFWSRWQQYGVDRASCLEIGCGAGRITKQLGETFDRVYAVDVSEDMVKHARSIVSTNVEISVIDGLHLPFPDRSVKSVFSTHVLQHLDKAELGYAYFREFFRVLDAGGTLMVHLPLYQLPGGPFEGLMASIHQLARHLGNVRAEIKRRRGIRGMRGTPYSIKALYSVLPEMGFKNIEFRIFPTSSNGHLHPFVFAMK